MGFSLYDINGYVGLLGSAHGINDLENYLKGAGPVLGDFFANDLTANIEEMKKEIDALDTTGIDPDVELSLKNIRSLLDKCTVVAFIWDGVNEFSFDIYDPDDPIKKPIITVRVPQDVMKNKCKKKKI